MNEQLKAVCILGMHRSGTSMITRSLNLLGVNLGKGSKLIMKEEKFNPKGHWEHKEITLRQQQILKKFSQSWDLQVPLPENWWKSKVIFSLKKRLKQIIMNDFTEKKLWGWKDPRTSLLLPMWQEIFQELNINPLYVIVVRNPLDVANSLYLRNGFSKEKAFRIWNLYTLSSFIGSEYSSRMVLHYEDFLKNWDIKLKEVAKTLGIIIPEYENLYKSVYSFINPEFQHSKSSLEDLLKEKEVSKITISLYNLALEIEDSPELLSSSYFKNQIHKMYKELYN
ncbi:sulfotransferase family protein [Priestia megaterium]|uniref:sulfotransferase family protein n=1 Tax=Priestia megaterium TaxID=1404 RepID=UPI003EF0297B